MVTPGLYWRTLRHLTPRQLVYQVWNRLRFAPRLRGFDGWSTAGVIRLGVPDIAPVAFTFLNRTATFHETVDWNYAIYGKLWTYHLNGFSYLNEPKPMAADRGLALLYDFVRQTSSLRDGLEPYPTSLRLVNWIQFLRWHQIQDVVLNRHLKAQARLVWQRLEYHLSGNHLLENGIALLMASVHWRDERWLRKATRLVCTELNRQIGPDGGHYEQSPTYHRLLLNRLITLLTMLLADRWPNDPELITVVSRKVSQMQGWLAAITFRNGDLPMMNDSISVTSTAGLAVADTRFGQPGYRMFRRPRYELLADVGPVGPDHQPGHAHADTLGFVLYVDNRPVLVDVGTSTYERNERRRWERSTAAHNTVEIAGQNSSEVWAAFRVGRRARVTILTDTETTLLARHTGYRHLGLTHWRRWTLAPDRIWIADRITGRHTTGNRQRTARFYAHPDVPVSLTDNGAMIGPLRLMLRSDGPVAWRLTPYEMAVDFNRLRPSICLTVDFATTLNTIIQLAE
ncbi:heparinase II/III family protein [Spirosoma sordidisoli]|uniref:Alginate lyase family protein n=1 Tax=Spirosoma sordidisoli TaxID=2502893 RepID=A0A4Q2UW65_9BACT|nr:heparinase II/III family protein [Spirosoma sordidisoli]RYC72095.1 alginate lyase family protein [Spirosoma sordidisoli]